MVRYFYAWMPAVVVVGTVVILTCPYLALIALMAVLLAAVAALGALALAGVSALYALGRSVPRRWRERLGASERIVLHPGGVGTGGTR